MPKFAPSRDLIGAFGYALAIAALFNAVLVILKESHPAVMTGLRAFTGHHWLSHGLLVLLTFAFTGWLLAWPFAAAVRSRWMAWIVAATVLASSATILTFFVARELL